MNTPRSPDWQTATIGLALSQATVLCVLTIASLGYGLELGLGDWLICASMAGLASLALVVWMRHRPPHGFIAILLVLWGAFSIGNVFAGWIAFDAYGDTDMVGAVIATDFGFPRWLLGTELLGWIYRAGASIDVTRIDGDDLVRLLAFVRWSGALVMMATGWIALARHRESLAAPFAVLTPLWLVFASGYSEYYPFVAGLFLLTLLWVAAQPLASRAPRWIGLIAGLLPAIYVGFLPLCVLLLVAYAIARLRDAPAAASVAAGCFFASIKLCWEDTPKPYFTTLYRTMLTPEVHEAYRGLGVMPMRVNFVPEYALSLTHAAELVYAIVFGFTVPLALLCVLIAARMGMRVDRASLAHALRDARTWFFGLLLLFMVRHFVFAIPKLGPRADIDFFWMFHLLLAVVIGRQFRGNFAEGPAYPALCIGLSSGVSGAYLLLVTGIPTLVLS